MTVVLIEYQESKELLTYLKNGGKFVERIQKLLNEIVQHTSNLINHNLVSTTF